LPLQGEIFARRDRRLAHSELEPLLFFDYQQSAVPPGLAMFEAQVSGHASTVDVTIVATL
jgi:hypothetical protein